MSFWQRLTLMIIGITFCFPLVALALQKGETVPEFKGETISGVPFDLTSLKGEPILVKIGTTWCGTCKDQAKAIDEMRKYLAENDVHFIDVFIQESSEKVDKYYEKTGYQLPETIILDSGDIARGLNVYLIPRVILIDKDYKVYRDGDNLSGKKLKNMLRAMIDESSEAATER